MAGTETATPILTVGSLFSGIGGLELGLERNNAQTRFQVEIDPTCRKVLAHHWPDVTRLEDVTDAGRSNLPAVDVLTGGFPCQDLSVAGRRAGLAGERSGLWWQFHRIIDELRPRWVIIENVPGLLSSNGGRDMGTVLGSLADLGYWWAYRVCDAQFFGVAQRRRRVFIVGHSGERAAPATVLLEPESRRWHPAPRREAGERVADSLTVGANQYSGFPGEPVEVPAPSTDVIKGAAIGRQPQNGPQYGEILSDDSCYTLNCTEVHAVHQRIAHSVAMRGREGGSMIELGGEAAHALRASQGGGDRAYALVQEVAGTLGSNGQGGFRTTDLDQQGAFIPMLSHAVKGGDPTTDNYVTTAINTTGHQGDRVFNPNGVWPSLSAESANNGGGSGGLLLDPVAVRRLTPTETLRIQGFPDHWLDLDPPISDSAKYRMVGNAVCVNVAEWIGHRIMEYEAAS